jgi:hypothetical protein
LPVNVTDPFFVDLGSAFDLLSEAPVADNTDTYAFVSPDRQDTLTLVANGFR